MSTPSFRHRTLRERMFGRSNRTSMGAAFLILPLVALVIVGIVGGLFASYTNSQIQTCTVSEKDRTRDNEGNSDMRVYTNECGVLKVSDMFFAGEWNSADTYNSIEEGKTYEFKTTGYRIGLFSMFPIIREVNEVETNTSAQAPAESQIAKGDTLDTLVQIESVPVGAVLRGEGVNFERTADGFQIVGTTEIKPADYALSFGPLTVTYLP